VYTNTRLPAHPLHPRRKLRSFPASAIHIHDILRIRYIHVLPSSLNALFSPSHSSLSLPDWITIILQPTVVLCIHLHRPRARPRLRARYLGPSEFGQGLPLFHSSITYRPSCRVTTREKICTIRTQPVRTAWTSSAVTDGIMDRWISLDSYPRVYRIHMLVHRRRRRRLHLDLKSRSPIDQPRNRSRQQLVDRP
jgi:hypothetical protein